MGFPCAAGARAQPRLQVRAPLGPCIPCKEKFPFPGFSSSSSRRESPSVVPMKNWEEREWFFHKSNEKLDEILGRGEKNHGNGCKYWNGPLREVLEPKSLEALEKRVGKISPFRIFQQQQERSAHGKLGRTGVVFPQSRPHRGAGGGSGGLCGARQGFVPRFKTRLELIP